MKKIYVIMLLCVPLLLFLGFRTSKAIGVSGGQEEQAQVGSYHRETDHISMTEVGKLLERLGKEIQKNNSVTVGGKSHPIAGQGGLELSVVPRGERTTLQIEIYAGATGTPTRGKTYVSYARGRQRGTPAEFTEILAKLGKTLASKGTFVMEDHSVALEGTASVVQRLMERTLPGRGRQQPYTFYLDVVFGENEFPLPEDEKDEVENEKRGDIKELAKQEMIGADHKAIAKVLDSLSNDLKAGKVRVGDKDLPVGENIQFGLTHLIATDGKSQRVRVGFQFGEAPPRKRPTGPRYGEEFFDAPMKKVAALLKRLGTEILESGTFKLGETEFKVKERATYEISASDRGFSIELQYTEPPKEK